MRSLCGGWPMLQRIETAPGVPDTSPGEAGHDARLLKAAAGQAESPAAVRAVHAGEEAPLDAGDNPASPSRHLRNYSSISPQRILLQEESG